MAKNSITPEPLRHLVNKARKRHNANNKNLKDGDMKRTKKHWLNDDIYKRDERLFKNIPNHCRTRRKADGSFYRIGWSTQTERDQELLKAS